MAGEADPKQMLNDLRQIAAVCQRLGIDLTRVAAAGQSIGGKATGGAFGTQNEGHDVHPGGGTGYVQVAGLATASSIVLSKASARQKAKYGKSIVELGKARKAMAESSDTAQKETALKGFWDAQKGYEEAASPIFGRGVKPPSPSKVAPKKASAGAMKARKSIWDSFGDKYQRRMTRVVTLLHGAFTAEDAFFGDFDPYSGESRGRKIGGWATNMAQTAMTMYAITAVQAIGAGAMAGWGGAKVAGRGFFMRAGAKAAAAARGARMAAGSAGGPWGLAAAAVVEAGIIASDVAMDNSNRSKRMRYTLGETKEGWSPSIKPQLDSKGDVRKPKVHSPETQAFMDVGMEGMREFDIDERGQRKRRGIIGWTWQGLFASVGWGGDTLDKEMEYRQKEANKAHESAKKKIAVGDYMAAMAQIKRAKEAVPVKELQPFLWKDPVKFLKQLESSRISSRNWARSQQPRGASRAGD